VGHQNHSDAADPKLVRTTTSPASHAHEHPGPARRDPLVSQEALALAGELVESGMHGRRDRDRMATRFSAFWDELDELELDELEQLSRLPAFVMRGDRAAIQLTCDACADFDDEGSASDQRHEHSPSKPRDRKGDPHHIHERGFHSEKNEAEPPSSTFMQRRSYGIS
jgi:hypothetical protein